MPRDLLKDVAVLQQTLIKDDCYIPGFKNEDAADLAHRAHVTASGGQTDASLVTDGIARNIGEENEIHEWISEPMREGGETLTLTWDKPVRVGEVRLTFDPDLNRTIVISLSSARQKNGGFDIPKELVRDYEVTLSLGGKETAVQEVRDNYQRLNVLSFPGVSCDRLDLHVRRTNGDPCAKVFEIGVYGQ